MPKELRNIPATIEAPLSAAPIGRKLHFATRAVALGKSVPAKKDPKKAAAKKRGGGVNGSDGVASGMVFNKGHGQHILRNPLVISAIVEKAAIKSTDVVLEIGPGTGNLTEKLLQVAKKVIAFEIDPRMVTELHKRFQSSPLNSKLTVIRGNCLDHEFPYFDKCVANVPYAISSALVFKLLKQPQFKCAVLMFQREFALRLCAKPGSDIYCRLSVNTQLLARCSHLMKVSKNSFTPPPKVESSVVRLDPRHPPPPVNFDEWDGLVKLLFNRKNKKCAAVFHGKSTFNDLFQRCCSYRVMQKEKPIDEAQFKAALEAVLADPLLQRRSRTLEQEEILQILNLFNRNGVHFA